MCGVIPPLAHPWSVPGDVLSRTPVPARADFFTAVLLTLSSPVTGAASDSQETAPVNTSMLGPLTKKHQVRILATLPQSYAQHCPDPISQRKTGCTKQWCPKAPFLTGNGQEPTLWRACGQNKCPLSLVTAMHVAQQFAVNQGQDRVTWNL